MPSSELQKRFWTKGDGQNFFYDSDGFLLDPESVGEEERPLVSGLTTLTKLRDVPCLMLLGSPGLGKTVELRGELARREDGSASLFVDLGSTRSETRLESKIFGSATYLAWLRGTHLLHLCLDSLDEAQANIGTIADLLADGLSDAPVDRLRLRFACREAERSRRLEDFLASRFPGDGLAIYQLLPLRLHDVRAIAENRDLDANAFVDDVIGQRLQALAMSPITLNMLLGIVAADGTLPHTRAEVYRQGCLLLCAEVAERREVGSALPHLTPGQRYAVAARIAAATTLAGCPSIHLPPGRAETDEANLEELAGGHEVDRSTGVETPFEVGIEEIRDTLKCALFKGVGDGDLTFSHRSYGEFLAAEWISNKALGTEQVEGLILERGDPGKPVWPQLQGLASWLGALSQEQFEWLLEHDAEAILDTDLALALPEHRRRIVDAWIHSRVELPQSSPPVDRAMQDLRWPEAIARLRDVLFDPAATLRMRVVSAQLIRAAGFSELDGELADLALDRSQPHSVRVEALRAMLAVAGEAARRRVVPLALANADDDPDDLIQAVALFVTWPKVLSTTKALEAFHPPSSRGSTSFERFYAYLLPQKMSPADFGPALRWSLRVGEKDEWAATTLRDKLLCVASDNLADPEIAEPYVELVVRVLCSRGRVISRSADCLYPLPFSNTDSRRILLQALVARVEVGELEASAIAGDFDLISRKDRAWVASRRDEAACAASAKAWSTIAAAIPPDRAPSFKMTRPKRIADQPPTRAAKIADAEVEQALGRFDAGDLDAFGVTLQRLRVDNEGNPCEKDQADIRSLPGWARQAKAVHDRIVSAAADYFKKQRSDPEAWFDEGKIPAAEWDAYRAVRLLKECSPEAIDDLDDMLWKRWAALVVAVDHDEDLAAWARSEAARAAPAEFSRWLRKRLDRDLEVEGRKGVLVPRYHVGFWTQPTEAVVLDRARDASLPPAARESLIFLLGWFDSAEGLQLGEEILATSPLHTKAGRDLAEHIAFALAIVGDNGGWLRIWPLMVADEDFARALITKLGRRGRYSNLSKKLSPRQQADLFTMLVRFFPRVVSDDSSGDFTSTQVKSWGAGLISFLIESDDPAAVEALNRLVNAFPDYEFLRYGQYLARLARRRAAWSPPAPRDVVELAQSSERRWIASAVALQEAVLASLNRAQAELRGQPPAAEQLWSNRPSRPKDESALSNWIALFLRRDLSGGGVVVGREVQVGATPSGGRGDSVDLQVDAVDGGSPDSKVHSVIIEVKGCWHRELDISLERQLVDRYLASSHRHGIYLVGWFGSGAWTDQTDGRRGRCKGASATELQQSLQEIAREVSQRRGVEVQALVIDCSLDNRATACNRGDRI